MSYNRTFKLSKEQHEEGVKLVLERLAAKSSADFESVYRHVADNLPHRLLIQGVDRRELARDIAKTTLDYLEANGKVIQTLAMGGVDEPGMAWTRHEYRLASQIERQSFDTIKSNKDRRLAKLTELTSLLKRFGITGIAFEDSVGLQVILKSEDDIDGLLALIRRK